MKSPGFLCLLGFVVVGILPALAQDVRSVRVALVQAQLAWGDVDGNLDAFQKRVEQCRDCDLIVFPELFVSGCEMKKAEGNRRVNKKDEVASRYWEVLERMKGWAKASDALVMGSTIFKEGGKYYNRLLAVFPDGTYSCYDKHNCFKKGSFSPGEGHLVLSWKGLRFSTFICYDLRFPEWSKNNDAYDVAVYIANWPESRGADWKRLLSERACENRAHVVAVNCAGTDLAGIVYKGESRILTPQGSVQAECADYEDDIVVSDIRIRRKNVSP